MPSYHSLVPGGFYSSNPKDMSVKRTIRTNNPWALNISEWQKTFPGYAGFTQPDNSPNANMTTIYYTPEQGIAAGVQLLLKYQKGGHNTVREIIRRYGGGQDYSAYEKFVCDKTGFGFNEPIELDNDEELFKLAKAMFQYEAGQRIPWSDEQIRYGLDLGQEISGVVQRSPDGPVYKPMSRVRTDRTGFLLALFNFIARLFSRRAAPIKPSVDRPDQILRRGDTSPKGGDVWRLQEKLRELGFTDLVVDGEFGPATEKAVRIFQERENLDPDGEVGQLTFAALNKATVSIQKPPLLPPRAVEAGAKPSWYVEAEKDIGWKEQSGNRGISYFINDTNPRTGREGDPYCAIGMNAWLGRAGVKGSGSAMARSFERHPDFIKLSEPTLGCIVTMWRGSRSSGQGHVFTYDGESDKGVRGIGANEDNMVKRSFHDRSRITGYWWPKDITLAHSTGPIKVSDLNSVVVRSET